VVVAACGIACCETAKPLNPLVYRDLRRQRQPASRSIMPRWGSEGHRGPRAQKRLPLELRQQVLDAIYAGQPFRTTVRDLGLTPNQVWGLTKSDEGWSTALEAAMTASRRVDLQHGTNAAYVKGCVCKECREHQRQRMAKNRG
jgi:hypothetical protein